ncbi:Vacuolar cation/proton exchanger like [Actinidia chinensis var. chinensis]|uniref:Vacuolar cation/proton exchanger like n=1 Tax=Actinidia chinensis var. chinensis TaxID=1590841 RepID=A0A2R6PTL8_ACTCC|nr:Vacuolar cation/proton exchanger like [Actinidia chinensis var. chinensis]
MATRPPPLSLLPLLLLLAAAADGRLITGGSPSDLVSDGVSLQQLLHLGSAASCDQTYGFMPCTTTAVGNLFLIAVYGYLMYLAATYLSSGSELLLKIFGPGIVGGLFLPILGALPDAMLILVSGLSGTSETAQSQVSVGMGLLAGSTVMLLTLIWGTCVIVGKCDLQDSIAVDGKDTKGFSLTDSGVSTDIWTSYVARIMAISIIPFLVVQIPQVMHSTSGKHLAVLIALIASLLLLISYFLYQVFQPWIQRRRLAYAKHKHVISGILGHLKKQTLGRLLRDDGKPNEEMIEKLFNKIDGNGDGYISDTEMRALIVGIRFDEIHLDENEVMKKVMTEFDTSSDSRIDLPEFIAGITKWLEEAKRSGAASVEAGSTTIKHLDNFHLQTKREHDLLGDQSDEIVEEVENPKWTSIKAACLLLVGTLIAAAFADPLVDAVDNFSDATSIPSFFISFIVLPLATNSSEAVSAIIFASRKRLRSSSLTFSEEQALQPLDLFELYAAAIWGGNHEQPALLIGLLSAGLHPGFDMGLLIRSSGYSHRLPCDGRIRQLPHHLPSLDIFGGFPPLPILPRTRIHS